MNDGGAAKPAQENTGTDAGDALRGAARSSVLSFAGAAISGLAGFGLSFILGRTVGPAGNGVVFQMISVFMIAGAFAKLGLDTTCVWLLPRLAIDRRSHVRPTTKFLLIGSLLGGVVTGIVVFFLAPVVSGGHNELQILIQIAGVFTPVAALGTVALAVTRGLGGIRPYVLIGSIGLPTIRLVAIAAAMAFATSALLAGTIWLVLLALATGLSLVAVRRRLRPFQESSITPDARSSVIRQIRSYSVPRLASSVMEQAILWQDVLIVGLIAGPTAAGVYGVVSRLAQAGFIPSTSMRIVVAPQFSRMLHQERLDELDVFYMRTTQWIALMCTPLYVLLVVFGEPVLRVFGNGFEVGVLSLIIVSIGALVWSSAGNVQSLLLMSGRSGLAALNKLIVLVVNLALLVTLIPIWGIEGAAIAWSISMTADVLLAVFLVRKVVGIRLNLSGTAMAVACALLTTAIPAVIARMLLGSSIPALIVGVFGAGILYLATLYFLRERFALEHAKAVFTRRGR